MRVVNTTTFNSHNRYKIYSRKKTPKKDEPEREEILFEAPGNTEPRLILSRANQIIIDKEDGSKELCLSMTFDGKGQYFKKIKLADRDLIEPAKYSYIPRRHKGYVPLLLQSEA